MKTRARIEREREKTVMEVLWGKSSLTLSRQIQRKTRQSTATSTASRAPPTHTPMMAPRGNAAAGSSAGGGERDTSQSGDDALEVLAGVSVQVYYCLV